MDQRLFPFSVVCICGAWLQFGCLIPEPPDLENAPGISVLGACMCSECWTQPFCVTDEDPSVVVDGDGNVVVPDSGGSCPAGSSPSPRASRVAADMNQRDDAEFYCIQPSGTEVDPAGVKCPSLDEGELQAAGFVSWDECQDTPVSCRHPRCENGPADGEPSCDVNVERGAIKSACKNRNSTCRRATFPRGIVTSTASTPRIQISGLPRRATKPSSIPRKRRSLRCVSMWMNRPRTPLSS